MHSPTHEEIAQLAHRLWQDQGNPDGHDLETWLEAERQLLTGETPAGVRKAGEFTARANAETAAGSETGPHFPSAGTEQAAGRAALMKHDARAPQVPHHTGPQAKPSATGKPIYPRPHSS